MPHLKHNATSGHLLHDADGNLIHACAEAECACGSTPVCLDCPDATPAQFHVTFVGVTLCPGCVACDAMGISIAMVDGSAVDGTYVMTHNGACAWTTFSPDVSCSANLHGSGDCTGSATPIGFAVQQVRINAHQFRLQVTDDSNTVLLFDAIVDADKCCAAYTVANALTTCGCGEDGESINLAAGGSATVTPC